MQEQRITEDLMRSFLKHKIDDRYVWIEEEIGVALYMEKHLGVNAEQIVIAPRSLWHIIFDTTPNRTAHNRIIHTSFGEFLLHEYGHHYFVMPIEKEAGSRYKHIYVAYEYSPPVNMRLTDTLVQMFTLPDVAFDQVRFYGGGILAHLSEGEFQEMCCKVHSNWENLLVYHISIYRHLPDIEKGHKFYYLNLGLVVEAARIETIGMGADNCPIDVYLVRFAKYVTGRRTLVDYNYGHIPDSALSDLYAIKDGYIRGILFRPYVLSVVMLDTDTRKIIDI